MYRARVNIHIRHIEVRAGQILEDEFFDQFDPIVFDENAHLLEDLSDEEILRIKSFAQAPVVAPISVPQPPPPPTPVVAPAPPAPVAVEAETGILPNFAEMAAQIAPPPQQPLPASPPPARRRRAVKAT